MPNSHQSCHLITRNIYFLGQENSLSVLYEWSQNVSNKCIQMKIKDDTSNICKLWGKKGTSITEIEEAVLLLITLEKTQLKH